MAKSEEKTGKELLQKKELDLPKVRVHPRNYIYIDRDNKQIEYEVHIPGVNKENLSLKILPDVWHLEAFRMLKKSQMIYTLTKYFPYIIDVDSTEAEYKDGLLKFKVKPKDPLEDAVEIQLS